MAKLEQKEFEKAAEYMLKKYVTECIENGGLDADWESATIQFQSKENTNSYDDRVTICNGGDTEFAVYQKWDECMLEVEDISA